MAKIWRIILPIITVLLVAFISVYAPYAYGNPYGLFGEGNCCKFAVDCMNAFWPMTPDINGDWDACRWAQLIGQQKDGYAIAAVEDIRPGDVFIVPKSDQYPRGHVGMVIGVSWAYSLEDAKKQLNYTVLESNMNATYPDFPLVFKGCRYRQIDYPADYLEEATFIRCVKLAP